MADLLHGEPEDSSELEDVSFWADVYAELLTSVRRVISDSATVPAELSSHVQWLQSRHEFWDARRVSQLEASQREVV